MKPLWLVLVPVTKFGPSFSFLLKLFSIVVKQKIIYHLNHLGFLDGSVVKNLPATAGDTGDLGLIPGWGRSPAAGNGTPLQCSCLENSMDRGAWQSTVDGVTRVGHSLATKQEQPPSSSVNSVPSAHSHCCATAAPTHL